MIIELQIKKTGHKQKESIIDYNKRSTLWDDNLNDGSSQEKLDRIIGIEKALFAKYQSNHVEHYVAILAAGNSISYKTKEISNMVNCFQNFQWECNRCHPWVC